MRHLDKYSLWEADLQLVELQQVNFYANCFLKCVPRSDNDLSIGSEGREFNFQDVSQTRVDAKVDFVATVR